METDTIIQLYNSSSNVVDIGCGIGNFSILLSKKVRSIDAVDINESRLDKLRHRCIQLNIRNITTYGSSAYKLPFGEKSFDLATFYRSIDHIEDPFRAICEAKRVLKKNGLVYLNFADTYFESPQSKMMCKWRAFEDELFDFLEISEGHCEVKSLHHDSIKEYLKTNSFRIEEFTIRESSAEDSFHYLNQIQNKILELLDILRSKDVSTLLLEKKFNNLKVEEALIGSRLLGTCELLAKNEV